MIPHVTEVIQGRLNHRKEDMLQVKHLAWGGRVEKVTLMKIVEQFTETICDMSSDKSPDVIHSAIVRTSTLPPSIIAVTRWKEL